MRKSIIVLFVVLSFMVGSAIGVWAEKQPRMHAAIKYLKSAREELRQASADKGGHRVKAMKFINEAIDEVEKGIVYDNRHRDK